MSEKKLVGLIPAKNEEETIGDLIDRLEEYKEDYELDLIVLSDSDDNTNKIVEERGYYLLKEGCDDLGKAMFNGIKESLKYDPDLIFSIDGDLQFRPEELGLLLEEADDYDLVLGSRFMENGVQYNMSFSHRLGNKFLNILTSILVGKKITDSQTGYRVMSSEVAEDLEMKGVHTYVQETIIDAVENGFTMTEVPINVDSREYEGSRVASSLSKYGVRTLPFVLLRGLKLRARSLR